MSRYLLQGFRSWWLVLLVQLSCLSGCSLLMPYERDDPLVGQIIDTKTQGVITRADLYQRIQQADIIYLGEKHDNADHHKYQLKIIEALVAAGKKPTLAFEFFDVGQTGYLMQYVFGHFTPNSYYHPLTKENRLRKKLGWQDRTDTEWVYYFNLIDYAKQVGLPLIGIEIPSSIITRMTRLGLDALTPVERDLLTPTGFSDANYKALMFEEFKAVHCGWGDPHQLQRLYDTWIARNDRMATALVKTSAQSDQPVVVILGSGHTRHNMGVYERVKALDPSIKQLNLGFKEIAIEEAPQSDYIGSVMFQGRQYPPEHEYIWLTQREHYDDPCRLMKLPIQH